MVKVSVLIPCYNAMPYLPITLDSVLAQTFQDWELIFVDNCSTDDSLRVANAYAARDTRIKIFQNASNLGMVGNWNRALGLAQGLYIKLLCADDVIYPNCLEAQSSLLDQDARISIVSGASYIIDESNRKLMKRRSLATQLPVTYLNGQAVVEACIAGAANLVGEPTMTMMRASVVERVGSFDPDYKYATDLEYWLRVLCEDGLISAFVSEVHAGFRLHGTSTTHSVVQLGEKELESIFEKYSSRFKNLQFERSKFARKYWKRNRVKGWLLKLVSSRQGSNLLCMLTRTRSLIWR